MATEIIDLTKDIPPREGIDDLIPGLPIELGSVAHKTIGVAKDGEILAYPVGRDHEEETPVVWIDPTGKKTDKNGLTQNQRRTIEYAETTPLFSSNDNGRIEMLTELSGVDLSIQILALHSLITPDIDQTPSPEEIVVYVNKDTVIDRPPLPEDRFSLIDVVTKIINDVAKRAQEAGTEEATQAALVRISNLVGLAMVISHPFEDGNGRVSRALYFFTRFGIPKTDDQKLAFGIVSGKRPEDPTERRVEVIRPNIKPGQPNAKSWMEAINFASSPKIPLTKAGQEQYEQSHSAHFFTLFKNTLA